MLSLLVFLVAGGQTGHTRSQGAGRTLAAIILAGALTGKNDEGWLIGASQGRSWLRADRLDHRIRAGQRYRLYSLTSHIGEVTGGQPVHPRPGEPGVDESSLWVPLARTPRHEGNVIGVAGRWNPMPRPVHVQSVDQPAYREAAATFLTDHGFRNPSVRLEQVIRADLDGAGQNAVILTAIWPMPRDAEGNERDYSIVLLRRSVGGHVRTYLLDDRPLPQPGKRQDFRSQEVIGVPDLNGDGRMEVVLERHITDGIEELVFALTAGRPVLVLHEVEGV